jgi:hypothetical protein
VARIARPSPLFFGCPAIGGRGSREAGLSRGSHAVHAAGPGIPRFTCGARRFTHGSRGAGLSRGSHAVHAAGPGIPRFTGGARRFTHGSRTAGLSRGSRTVHVGLVLGFRGSRGGSSVHAWFTHGWSVAWFTRGSREAGLSRGSHAVHAAGPGIPRFTGGARWFTQGLMRFTRGHQMTYNILNVSCEKLLSAVLMANPLEVECWSGLFCDFWV